jgi:uroporphyrinogen III methyltransferase/synthase
MSGRVHLVGAGPGGAGLLTARALRCLADADVVVHDDLVPRRLLDFVRPDAEIVAVGPVHARAGRLAQDDVETLLVDRARAGRVVVRLKNGDPMLFGRGGEEAAVLAAAGVPFEIVPGVTSALAVPAYAGIPVTHRDYASAVTIVTGHQAGEDAGASALPGVDWGALARVGGTLVFLMGVRQLADLLARLVAEGLAPDTPAAIVRWGGTGRQTTITGTATTLAERAAAAGIRPPAVVVVGEVVRLRAQLAWWERRPLFGRRVVVTRARRQAGGLADRLEELGADVLTVPTIALVDRLGAPEVRRTLTAVDRYDWLVFTSTNGVRCFMDGLRREGVDLRALGRAKIAAIGTETAKALGDHLLTADVVPTDFRAEGLLAALGDRMAAGQRVLLPRAAGSRSVLPDVLRGYGAEVDDVALYEAVVPSGPDAPDGDVLRDALVAGTVDAVTFTSSSTVRNFVTLLGADAATLVARSGAAVACIGPVTAEAAAALGLTVGVQPAVYTVPALVDALVAHFCATPGDPLSGRPEPS